MIKMPLQIGLQIKAESNKPSLKIAYIIIKKLRVREIDSKIQLKMCYDMNLVTVLVFNGNKMFIKRITIKCKRILIE
ncbi:MAG: hypothetical protein WCQ54_05425 [Clostridiaceae bacterium]